MMGNSQYDQLNDMHIDVLRELGNIGAGNAATALSMMLMQTVQMSVPTVKVLDFNDLVNILGGPEKVVVGILTHLVDDVNGMIMFILDQEFAHVIVNILLNKQINDYTEMTEVDFSAINEIGNIMSASYVNAIASLTGLKINITVPSITVDMAGAILSVPAIEMGMTGDKVLYIEEDFLGDSEKVKSCMLLIPEMDSLKIIMERLGIEL